MLVVWHLREMRRNIFSKNVMAESDNLLDANEFVGHGYRIGKYISN